MLDEKILFIRNSKQKEPFLHSYVSFINVSINYSKCDKI